jgi:hypothetical protein
MRRMTVFLILAVLAIGGAAHAHEGRVVDAETGVAIANATVGQGSAVTMSDAAGRFRTTAPGPTIRARAPGYRGVEIAADALADGGELRLTPFAPKALYLSFYGVGDRGLRSAALDLIRDTALNALVIDIKGDHGLIAYPSEVALAREVGARRLTTIPDLPAFVKDLHFRGVYAIARIVVFKDDPLATAASGLAVKDTSGKLFRDREGLAWADPFRREVWSYNIDIAVEAARAGFDEIQFDYVRFPDDPHARFSGPSTRASRTQAINGFLSEARRRLQPYNSFLAIAMFGYACWNPDDTQIGQQLEDLVDLVDYVSPMLYPSGFQFGIPGIRDPVAHPYEIVRRSLEKARERTGVSPARFRPWLQAFKDYAFDRRPFDADEVQAQIRAAEEFGTNGWMLWNPRNVYKDIGLKPLN